MKIISLFSGAGGLDLGFEAAGFDVAVAVELDRDAVSTLRANRTWTVLDRDIHQISSAEILKAGRLHVGEAAALIGGPPCQPFSKAGYWVNGDTLRLDDVRAGTLGAFLRVLRDCLPTTFLLENVEGIAYKGKSDALGLLFKSIERINRERGVHYQISMAKLNAADYGVPQIRERYFIIGSREGHTFAFPPITHAPEGERSILQLEPYRTAWDAIGGLPEPLDPSLQLSGKWAALLPTIPEGENYLWHTERGGGFELFGWRRRYWTFLLKLAKRLPAWTIQAQPGPATGPFHWRNRRLSAAELSRLQTFPDNYRIQGDIRAAQRQLGNAVPSALAEVLARAMRRQLLRQRNVTLQSSLVPARRRKIPDEEPHQQDLPRQYRALVGRHEAHPGTGKGYAAAQRSVG